jgi:hypothetical protein
VFRRILGFALLAVVGLLAVRIAFGLFGAILGLAVTVLTFAAIGYVGYLALRVLSPGTAAKLRQLIAGRGSGDSTVSPRQPPRIS